MASPTNPAMMPVTIRTRCSRVAEIICTYNPTRHETSPVSVARTITAAPVWAFLITMPRAKDTRPSTSVMMVRMFWTGCGCPSEFRMLWRRPESTGPATVTTSRKVFTGSLPRRRSQESTGFPAASARWLPRASDVGYTDRAAENPAVYVRRLVTATPPATERPWPHQSRGGLRTPMRHYELMIILDPNLEEKTVQPSLDQFLKVVTSGGGKVEEVDIWGKRRLPYQIEKKSEGFYAVVDLTAEPSTVLELDRQLNLNESILRTKVTRPDHH